MIKPNELRLDNYLQDNKGNIGKVVIGLGGFECAIKSVGFVDISKCEGVPITPEILEKCGFTKQQSYNQNVGDYYQFKMTHYIGILSNEEYNGEIQFYKDGSNNIADKEIHLHQLQNYIFCFTGEELNVSL